MPHFALSIVSLSLSFDTIIDVYQEWAGPTVVLEEILLKLKRQLPSAEYLTFYSANCETIEALKRYRGFCDPLLLFFGVSVAFLGWLSMDEHWIESNARARSTASPCAKHRESHRRATQSRSASDSRKSQTTTSMSVLSKRQIDHQLMNRSTNHCYWILLNTIQSTVEIQDWRARIREDRVTRKGPVRYWGIYSCMPYACIYPCSVQRWIGQSTKFTDENGGTDRRRVLVKSRHVADGIKDQYPWLHWPSFLEPYRLSVGLFVIKPDLVAGGKSEEIIDQVRQLFENRDHCC